MDKEKIAPPIYAEVPYKDTQPILQPVQERAVTTTNILLTVLLVTFVSCLACFAVYTIVSMNSSVDKFSPTKEPLVGKTIVPNNEEPPKKSSEILNNVRPNFRFAIYVNGKPAITGGSGNTANQIPTTTDGFSAINSFFRRMTSAERNDDLSKETREDKSDDRADSSEIQKPKVVRTESWTIRRIPFDEKVSVFRAPMSPFSDIRSMFFPRRASQEENDFPFSFVRKSSGERKAVMVPETALSRSSEENKSSSFRSPLNEFKSLFSMIDDMVNTKMSSDSSSKEIAPKDFTPQVRIIPLTIKRFRILSTVRPNANSVESEPKTWKPTLNKYTIRKSSEESNEFLNKFLGRPFVNKMENLASAPAKASSEEFGFSPLFKNLFDPLWPRLNIDLRPKAQNGTENDTAKTESKSPKQVLVESSEPADSDVQLTPKVAAPMNSSNATLTAEKPAPLVKEEILKIAK